MGWSGVGLKEMREALEYEKEVSVEHVFTVEKRCDLMRDVSKTDLFLQPLDFSIKLGLFLLVR